MVTHKTPTLGAVVVGKAGIRKAWRGGKVIGK